MDQNGKFMQKHRDHKTTKRMVNIFAVALKVRIDFLLRKMQCLSPTDITRFQQSYLRVRAIVLSLKDTVTQTRVNHQHDI